MCASVCKLCANDASGSGAHLERLDERPHGATTWCVHIKFRHYFSDRLLTTTSEASHGRRLLQKRRMPRTQQAPMLSRREAMGEPCHCKSASILRCHTWHTALEVAHREDAGQRHVA